MQARRCAHFLANTSVRRGFITATCSFVRFTRHAMPRALRSNADARQPQQFSARWQRQQASLKDYEWWCLSTKVLLQMINVFNIVMTRCAVLATSSSSYSIKVCARQHSKAQIHDSVISTLSVFTAIREEIGRGHCGRLWLRWRWRRRERWRRRRGWQRFGWRRLRSCVAKLGIVSFAMPSHLFLVVQTTAAGV